jgi:hypothetical protein
LPQGAAAHGQVSVLVSKLWHFPTITVRTNAAAELQAHLHELFPAGIGNDTLELEALPTARHAVTYRAITLRSFRIRAKQLPRLPDAKTIPLSEVPAPSSFAISNLTRKAACAALASPAALPARA